jgi:hypothetical protein
VRQGYVWAIITRPERRLQLLHEGWRGAMTPFLLAIVLDRIYQIMTLARLFLPAARSPPSVRPDHSNKFIR